MEKKTNFLNIMRLIYDDNFNAPYKASIITSLASASLEDVNDGEPTNTDEIYYIKNDVTTNIVINNLEENISSKFPLESCAKRMLTIDNNDPVFQNDLARIFNLKSLNHSNDGTIVTKSIQHDTFPVKRSARSLLKSSENKEVINDENAVKCDTYFKTASGKDWAAGNNNSKLVKSQCNNNNESVLPNISNRNNKSLGLSRSTANNSSRQTSCMSKPQSIIKKEQPPSDVPEIKGIEPKMVELILNEILDKSLPVDWDDVAGLEFAKSTIKEIIIWPMLRPDIFTGLRGPPKGVLLFGPPGTGKTLIGKCIASKSKATFFSISASSLTSKWVGEGEKMVRSLFAVAKHYQPSVIFIDEIDSLLTQRCDGEHESSRRIKTEFLVQLDGCGCFEDERVLVIGATNRPQELDEAARRRLVKKLYIPLPDAAARKQIIQRLLKNQKNTISDFEIDIIVKKTDGYSGADVTNLCKEAAISPLRAVMDDICTINVNDVPPITLKDFESALKLVKSSVSPNDLHVYHTWNEMYGTMTIPVSDNL